MRVPAFRRAHRRVPRRTSNGATSRACAPSPSQVDSLGSVPLSVVTSPGGPDTGVKPEVPFEETVIHELHVKGFTQQHPDVPEPLRGTYLGLAHPAVIEHPMRLGITPVELLPVQTSTDGPARVR